MALQIYNTMTRQKEPFQPLEAGSVRMYSCGPTVYDYIHLGNARAFVVPDIIKRYLRFRGYEVVHVQNITDIEDKIIQRAQERGVGFQEIVDQYTEAYFADVAAIGCLRPEHNPKASEHIPDMIAMIERLLERGLAYERGGDVMYAVRAFERYGELSGQSLDDLVAGARVEVDAEKKEHPGDFVLWKAAKPGEPAWESPWGAGRPGWHIECSAMSTHYLGDSFDIHTGGADLIFPHHENEIAQSEGATGETFVRYWVHNGYINVDGEKMAKSRGNFFTLREILRKYAPPVIRLFLISKHYRSPIEFNAEVMRATQRGYERLTGALQALWRRVEPVAEVPTGLTGEAAEICESVQKQRQAFEAGMDDDFNTPVALAALYELARTANAWTQSGDPLSDEVTRALGYLLHEFTTLASVLGLDLTPAADATVSGDSELTAALVDLILELRHEARQRKEFAVADRIRDALQELGIVLKDGPDGTEWSLAASGEEE